MFLQHPFDVCSPQQIEAALTCESPRESGNPSAVISSSSKENKTKLPTSRQILATIWLLRCKSALEPNLGEKKKKKHDANCTHERRDERSNCVGESSASGSVIYLPVFPSVAAGEPRCRRCGGLDSGPLGWRRGRGITKRTRDLRPDWLNT